MANYNSNFKRHKREWDTDMRSQTKISAYLKEKAEAERTGAALPDAPIAYLEREQEMRAGGGGTVSMRVEREVQQIRTEGDGGKGAEGDGEGEGGRGRQHRSGGGPNKHYESRRNQYASDDRAVQRFKKYAKF